MNANCPASIADKRRELEAAMAALKNSQERLAWVTQRGRAAASLPATERTDANHVEGCLAKTWLVREFADGRCRFRADSESAIIKGIAVLLCDFFSGQTPEEIMLVDTRFLEEFGITQHLTPNRRNSLSTLFKRIRQFAADHVLRRA